MRSSFLAALAAALVLGACSEAFAQQAVSGRPAGASVLQGSFPGTRQTGHINVSGMVQSTLGFCILGRLGNCTSGMFELENPTGTGTGGIGFRSNSNGSSGVVFSFVYLTPSTPAQAYAQGTPLVGFGYGYPGASTSYLQNTWNGTNAQYPLQIYGDGRLFQAQTPADTEGNELRGLRILENDTGTQSSWLRLTRGRGNTSGSALIKFSDYGSNGTQAYDATGWALGSPSGSSAFSLVAQSSPDNTTAYNATAFSVSRSATPVTTIQGGGLQIGTSGTPITSSPRGTVVWNPGTVTAGSLVSTTVTVTGATTSADCIAGVLSPAPLSGFAVQCIITAADTCSIGIKNQSAGSVSFGSATFYCRAFNP